MRKITILVLAGSLAILLRTASAQTIAVVKRPFRGTGNRFYTGDRAPLLPLYFVKLPVGSIRPGGWVRKYLELQRDGLTGQLGNISAWLDKNNNAWFSGNGKGDHGWEEVPYWLKGYGDLGYILKDTAIIAETKRWLDKVFESQTADGHFGPRSPDLWPNMLMLWCVQSYYDYSHDPRVLPFMTKYFKWEMTVPEEQLLKTYWENSRGGDNLISIYWLYDRTGEPWLLELAKKIHRNTANWAQKDSLPNWHNVNIAQCFREPATYFLQARDTSFLVATYHDFDLVRRLYGQVPGGMFGADENARKGYDDPRQAIETCGIVEQMASDEILTSITGDPAWADNCENVAFNTYPAAVMPDFKGLRYLTAPNMVISDSKNHAPGIQNEGPFLMMNPFSSRCCQHNHAQGWPYYAEHLWMATPDNGIAAILYGSSEVTAKVGGLSRGKDASITLRQTTNYPFDDNIKIEFLSANAGNFPLYLRIPAWCPRPTLRINGAESSISTNTVGLSKSYIKIDRAWKAGDVVELSLPMHLFVQAWPLNKNSISINYGPLTFSVKIAESYKRIDGRSAVQSDSKWQASADQTQWPSYEIYPASMWNYGLSMTNASAEQQFELIKRPWPADNFPFTPESVPLLIKAKARIIPEWTLDQYGLCGLLPVSPVSVNTPETTIELIPMGAARLRISSMPVIKNQ